jgi:hypothetical protein
MAEIRAITTVAHTLMQRKNQKILSFAATAKQQFKPLITLTLTVKQC